MSVGIKAHKMLWGRSGSRCAFPECRRELVVNATETDDESLIGEEGHIVAKSENGPRGQMVRHEKEINEYNNLILLCGVHHKIVDDQRHTYTVERLRNMKSDHERWVKNCLTGHDLKEQRDKEICAFFIEKWLKLAHINDWENWTSPLFELVKPELWVNVNDDFFSLREWLLKRNWPERYPELRDSFENFRRVLEDLQNTFHRHSEKGEKAFHIRLFYEIDEWNPPKWETGYKKFVFHITLIQDLTLELTRSANYICDRVRQYMDHSFRLEVGKIMVRTAGMWPDLWRYNCDEYEGRERISIPYPGLKQFMTDRTQRNRCIGAGESPEDPVFLDWYRDW